MASTTTKALSTATKGKGKAPAKAAPKAPTKAAPAKAAPKAAPAKAAPVAAPAPATYTLTDKGKALAPRPESDRARAWVHVVEHAGKPGGAAKARDAIGKGKYGAITGANMLGWARKAGLVA